jgi:hypothetical protein
MQRRHPRQLEAGLQIDHLGVKRQELALPRL